MGARLDASLLSDVQILIYRYILSGSAILPFTKFVLACDACLSLQFLRYIANLTTNIGEFMVKVVLFNKPFGVHSQFRKDNDEMRTLADFFDDPSLRVAGRLDKDSEGLLLLTDSGALAHIITTPPTAKNAPKTSKLSKTYLVQVENLPTDEQLKQLRSGVLLNDGMTLPAKVVQMDENNLPIPLWVRNPPIRERKNIPTAWLMISIHEGRNRQVRRMTAAVGLPCLRLIRVQIGQWALADLAVGKNRTLQLDDQALAAFGITADGRQGKKQPSARSLRGRFSKSTGKLTNKPARQPKKKPTGKTPTKAKRRLV